MQVIRQHDHAVDGEWPLLADGFHALAKAIDVFDERAGVAGS